MKHQISKTVFQVAKFLLILLFTYTGISKLSGHEQFEAQLSLQPHLAPISLFLSWILPVAELLTVLFILFERTLLLGLMSATFLMTAFTIYVAGMLLFRGSLPCSCGGVIAQMTWKEHLIFNFFFMCLSWEALIYHFKQTTQRISTNTKEVS
ncbi:MAG TPA: MauE/DoxX family redox-associated membrane protein [Hanamia sp.]|nr:MauE/DoxX family redox-associated membrane protein [Hanamia sp.]